MTDISKRVAELSPEKRELLLRRLKKGAEDVSGTQTKTKLPTVMPAPEERHKPFPLTEIQQAYWIGRSSSFELGGVSCHIYREIESQNLDVERLQLALRRLIDRHEMLRAIFLPDGRQQILEQLPPYELRVLDLRGEGPRQATSHLEAVRSEMSHQVLPSDRAPMFEFRASLLDNQRVRLHVSLDLLVSDARSFQIFFDELHQFYENPEAILRPLDLSFRDYVLTTANLQDSELYRRSKEYWLKRLSTLPQAPELPLATNPIAVKEVRFGRRSARIESESWRRLKGRAAKAGLTPSVLLLAAYSEVLGLWSKNPRFTINLTLFNRLPLHPQINDVIGDFTSVTMLEVDTAAQPTFKARARHLQQQLWADMDHRYFGGVQVLRELAKQQGDRHGVAMPVVFTSVLSDQVDRKSPTPTSWMWNVVYDITQTPQVWLDHTVFEWAGELAINWDAVEELFPAGLLDDMFDAYCRLLRRLADEEESWQESRFGMASKLVPPAQVEQRRAINTTESPLTKDLLHSFFFEQALQRPDQTAVITPKRTLSYKELQNRANQAAHWLRQRGAHPNSLVAVVMEKGWEQVVGVLGVLASGAAYLPIDATLPKERLAYILEHGQVSLVLTQAWHDQKIDWPAGIQRFCVDQADELGLNESSLEPVQKPGDLAYVIYTSGSTGLPKGVVIDHRGAVNTILDINQRFQVKPEDRVLALSALNFDLSVYDVFGLLAAGGTIVMPEAFSEHDPNHWAELVVKHGVTMWDTVPALMQMLVEYLAGRSERLSDSLRLVMMSGDWIPVDLPDRIKNMAADVKVVGLGGATEASIWSILYPIEKVEPSWTSIPYGRPMVNQSFQVLNDALAPCPVWVPGQLYIGGIGLAKGYWRDEEKTQTSFITHPQTGERLYRTGDLGRYLPDGNIEFLGREDFQVKIRGHRIELGEIETTLLKHPRVQASVVTAAGEGRENKRLVAYVVPIQEPVSGSHKEKSPPATKMAEDAYSAIADELREFLRGKLPEYMVPVSFVLMDALPLSANGKVDRKALPKPEMGTASGKEYVAPRTDIERTIAEVWKEVLEQEQIGVHDDFFELGGHSLLATQAMSRINRQFNMQLPLRRLFEGRTIVSLAEVISEASEPSFENTSMHLPKILPVPRDQRLPLSFSQERLWFLHQFEPESAAYSMPISIRMRGILDKESFKNAFEALARRHEILRTSFRVVGEQAEQVISTSPEITFVNEDLRELPGQERESEAARLANEQMRVPFDLSKGPLFRVAIFQLGDEDHLVHINMHHAVCDYWSFGVMNKEFEILYNAFAGGTAPKLPDLPVQYADFAYCQRKWLQGEVLEQHLAYWRTKLGGDLTPLELPMDRPRPAVQSRRGAERSSRLPRELVVALEQLSRVEKVSLFMVLLSAFKVLLSRYSGQHDIVIGTPIAGRNREELEGLIGFFINTVVMRTDLDGDPTFEEAIARVRDTALEAHSYQDMPFEKLVEALTPQRDLSRTPLFQIFFNHIQVNKKKLELKGIETEVFGGIEREAMFDLTLYVMDYDDAIDLKILYNADLFDADRIEIMLEQYLHLLKQVADNPNRKIYSYSLDISPKGLLPNPYEHLNSKWLCAVHERFSSQAILSVGKVAITDSAGSWDYGDLDCLSNQIANRLLAGGVEKGDIVAVYGHRSAGLVMSLLGILKAGAAFLILDPAYPAARLVKMLQAAQAAGLLLLEAAGEAGGELDEFIEDYRFKCCLKAPRSKAALKGILSGVSSVAPGVSVGPEDMAYLIFTSGTTGEAKGVVGIHRPLSHFIDWHTRTYGLRESDRFSMLSGLSHDPLLRDIFTPLWVGGTLCIPEQEEMLIPERLRHWMREQRITVSHMTPALSQVLTEGYRGTNGGEEGLPALRYIFFGGDVLTGQHVERARGVAPGVECINFYGTTETPQAMGYHVVGANEGDRLGRRIPLGRGIEGAQLLIINHAGRLAGIGELGEIHVRTPYLSKGYLNESNLTDARYIENPYTSAAEDRLYKTGDLGRYMSDGEVMFYGREDGQVSVRGFRVELGEVEASIQEMNAVINCVVISREDRPGDQRLVAYYVPKDGEAVSVFEVRRHLQAKLPDYMVPQHFVQLASIPLTPNGKVDRKALPMPEAYGVLEQGFVAPRTETEQKIAAVWQEVLNWEKVGVHDDFFELGGHSLLATQVISRINQLFNIQLTLRRFFEARTLKALAEIIDTSLWSAGDLQEPGIAGMEEREIIEL